MSMPRTWISPTVGSSRPSNMAMVVVLPAPLPPSRPSTAPRGTVKVRSSTATTVPYTLRRCRTSMERVCAMAASQCLDRALDAIETLAESLGARREAEANVALPARGERFARRGADLVFLRELLAEGHRVGDAVDRKERIERRLRPRDRDARQSRQTLEHELAAGTAAIDHLLHEVVALFQRRDGAALQEGRYTRGVDLHQLGNLVAERRRMREPAQSPARHRPGLGETVEHQHRIVRSRDLEERRRNGARVNQARIDLVGHDPEAPLLGEVEQGALFVGRHRPAGRIAGRIDEDRARALVDAVEDLLEVQFPAAVRFALERHVLGLGA